MISLTSIEGDPDIYVSTRTQKPTMFDHEWSHVDWGSDFLIITPGVVGTYYIGIYGYQKSVYNILVSHKDSKN